MAQNKGLNELLKWSIENSTTPTGVTSTDDSNGAGNTTTTSQATAPRTLDPEVLSQLLGGPSDAELMQAAIAHVVAGEADGSITLASRLTALDNLEQLVESLDNANLLAALGLWTPLLGLLGHPLPDIRRMAAWCVATAVQNNAPCQERLLALGGVERLVALALGERVPFFVDDAAAAANNATAAPANAGEEEEDNGRRQEEKEKEKEVRRKAVSALSSAVRNYQPALDACVRELRRKGASAATTTADPIDATDMDAVNALIDGLRQKALDA